MTQARTRDLGEATERAARFVSYTLVVGLVPLVVAVVSTAIGAAALAGTAGAAALACTALAIRIAWPLASRVHQVREGVILERLANDPTTRTSLNELADDVLAGRVPREGKTIEEYKERWGR